jgi:hypothetical protein
VSSTSPQDRDSLNPLVTAVVRRGHRYADTVEEREEELPAVEGDLLDMFEGYANDVLEQYSPASARRTSGLVFESMYEEAGKPPVGERRRSILIALLAAEVEVHGPFRLTRAQNEGLADIFFELGKALETEKLFKHAELAYDRAASNYLLSGDAGLRDESLMRQKRCQHLVSPRGLRRGLQSISWLAAGYGYRPYRLLICVVAQLVLFVGVLAIIARGTNVTPYAVLVNYLNPLGPQDADGVHTFGKVLLVAESYAGAVSLNVFFALLVRRWFR